jgi:hypothetical protein
MSSVSFVYQNHRVGRVLRLSSSRRNWDSLPTPHLQASVPRPLWFRGEGNTRWREMGWESPNSDEGTLRYSLYIDVLCDQNKKSF